jgi:hypothetical protein
MSNLDQSIANLTAAKNRYGTIQVRELLIEHAFSGIPLHQLCRALEAADLGIKPNLYHRLFALSRADLADLIDDCFDGITIITDDQIEAIPTFAEWLATI